MHGHRLLKGSQVLSTIHRKGGYISNTISRGGMNRGGDKYRCIRESSMSQIEGNIYQILSDSFLKDKCEQTNMCCNLKESDSN